MITFCTGDTLLPLLLLGTVWTATETEIWESLALKVRTFTEEQIAKAWNISNVEKFLDPLCAVGVLERRTVFAHPIINIHPAACQFDSGDQDPRSEVFEALAKHFQGRWTQAEQQFNVYVTTRTGANQMGSYAIDPPANDQWTHDIHTSEIFIELFRDNGPEIKRHLVGEGALPKLGKEVLRFKDPDLFLLDEHRQAQIVFEFAGAYDEKHIRDLVYHCSGDAHRKLKKRFPNRKHYLYPNPRGTQLFLF